MSKKEKSQKVLMVQKISIRMGDKIVDLTLEQAQELQRLLNKTFGQEKDKEYIPIPSPYPYPEPYPVPWPIIPYDPYRRWDKWSPRWESTDHTLVYECIYGEDTNAQR